MNIFFLSMSIFRCAMYHFDKHVIKMILEMTQLLSTAWHVLDPENARLYYENELIYKATHINHPCAIWTRVHVNNYTYVAKLGLALCNEWRFRYNHERTHACESKLLFMLTTIPTMNDVPILKTKHNPKMLSIPLPQAMPIECKVKGDSVHSAVRAYRRYYKSSHKKHLRSWTKKRNNTKVDMKKPPWFTINN